MFESYKIGERSRFYFTALGKVCGVLIVIALVTFVGAQAGSMWFGPHNYEGLELQKLRNEATWTDVKGDTHAMHRMRPLTTARDSTGIPIGQWWYCFYENERILTPIPMVRLAYISLSNQGN